ncbi:TetR/AcrR family transcriptional regulator [Pseudoteredinibacter isoporae]|uniref:AcrR family transcriptional regulator n=1 Tax=Pseudoteredinibacter isoporae TaxID=570281 RepID=A0A7X0JRP8_9GAMM|nr:TetR/AcrR family transcriptional regulator [Pseudoteredinibacter isoporae]MBB6520403.1 AcrR family transcriptional regulator [Pseudoteredinibacter isoporae]NHO85971.1 TetR/AcrR family transcriptional regulator [Pseudoteredinibacter isoporae]NIB25577.1 TetR/AcrR family transcriptional regulator [Pseudoteredinibacter isoporae]
MSATQTEKRSQAQRREATRQAILQACKAIMSEEDFAKSKTGTIAKRAGVAEGTVFLHFENKQGLLRALIDEFFDTMHANIELINQAHSCPKRRLRAMAEDYIQQLEAQWPLARLVVSSYARYGDEQTQQALHQHNRRYTQFFINALEEIIEKEPGCNIPSPVFRDAFFGAIEHFAIANFSTGKSHDSALFLEQLWQLLFRGILSRENTEQTPYRDLDNIDKKLDRLINKLDA